MKNLVLYFILIISTATTIAQNIQFKDSLQTVVLTEDFAYEYYNDLNYINVTIIDDPDFNIRKEIRSVRADKKKNLLNRDNGFGITKLDYLKILKKAANYSDSSDQFQFKLVKKFPELKPTLLNDYIADGLYRKIRKDTFYGRIEALPSVL